MAKKTKAVAEKVAEETEKVAEKVAEEKEVVVEKTEVVVESRFKCDNCEDSGMVCYKCNHK